MTSFPAKTKYSCPLLLFFVLADCSKGEAGVSTVE